MYRGRIKNFHFVGIGGSGMCGIAEVLLNMGYHVTGSDARESEVTRRLQSLGAKINIGHEGGSVAGADCLVYSSAVTLENPELVAARELRIPIIRRAEMLAELMSMKYGIAVAGTHGKTTTTSMTAAILGAAAMDPTIVTGGKLNNIGTNAKLGTGEFLVAEADESDGTFLKLSQTIGVVTNIDREHMEHYGDMESLRGAYLEFINKVPFYGCTVLCGDDEEISALMDGVTKRVITYGLSEGVEIRGGDLRIEGSTSTFDLYFEGESQGRMTINMPGRHNVYNALAAIGVARELDIELSAIKEGLASFDGVERRFQILGEAEGVLFVDDYGHHPSEVRAVLKAAEEGYRDRRKVVVFQPHRYTRTRDLFSDFLGAFGGADRLVLADIYGAGEERIIGVTGEALFEGIRGEGGVEVDYVPNVEEIPAFLSSILRPGDMVITLGAGDIWKVGGEALRLLGTDEGEGR